MSGNLRVVTPSDDPPRAEGIAISRLRTLIQDSHLNLLIGAGTSAPYFALLGQVEDAMTELSGNDDASRIARSSVQAYFFRKVLQPNLSLLDPKSDPAAVDLIKSYARFIGVLNQILLKRRSTELSKQVNLFTTNVDMASEVALEWLEVATNDGFSGKMKPRLDLGEYSTLRYRQGVRYEYRSEIPTVNLFKIHGSVAWDKVGDEIYFDHSMNAVRLVLEALEPAQRHLIPIESDADVDVAALRKAAEGKTYSAEIQYFSDAYSKLQIVNPEKTKFASTVLNKTYYELIRRFTNELEKESCVLLVHGFSFADEHLRDLITRAAATNPTLQIVIFCFNRKSFDSISAYFPNERVKNGNVLFVRPVGAEEDEAEHVLSLDNFVSDWLEPILEEKPKPADQILELRLGEGKDSDYDA